MILHRTWHVIHGRELFEVTVAGAGGDTAAQARAAHARALIEIEKAGLSLSHVVRSRIWGRDAAARTAASDVRKTALAGDARGASASFSDAERLAPDSNMVVDIIALKAPADARKSVVEYDPAITPPRYVRLDEMVFLSGNTDVSPEFAQQVEMIGDKIDDSLARGGATWRQAVLLTAFVAKSVDLAAAKAALAARFPDYRGDLTLHAVDGFSAPEKLIEIETTADLRRPA